MCVFGVLETYASGVETNRSINGLLRQEVSRNEDFFKKYIEDEYEIYKKSLISGDFSECRVKLYDKI